MKAFTKKFSIVRPAAQQGFTLITTLFIIVVLAVLGSFMALLVTGQNQSSALSVQGLRAWYAGVSGYEWAIYQINSTGSCPAVPTVMSIEGFTVTLTDCTAYNVTEAGDNYSLHDITVLSERGSYGDTDYVSRKIRTTMGGL